MLKTWEKMARDLTTNLSEIPENAHDLIHVIQEKLPEMLINLGLSGSMEVKFESLIAAHRFGSWGTYGMPIFKVTEDLLASLLLTDPKNITVDEVKFPYKAFLIRIPDGFWKLESFIDGKSEKIPWVWAHEYSFGNMESNIQPWWRVDAVAVDGTCITYFNYKPEGDLSDFLGLGKIIDSPLYTGMNQFEKGISFAIRRLLVNLCLYISEVGNLKKQKSYKNPRKKKKTPTTWIVGSDIRISQNLLEASRDWARAKQGGGGEWTIKKRFTVRGHWRNQPYGEGKKLKKKIWIAPHWKGPGKGEKLPRVYTVET